MLLFVKTTEGSKALRVNPETTIAFVKKKINIGPPAEIVLQYQGKVLQDHKTISEYQIEEQATLHASMRLRGGGDAVQMVMQRQRGPDVTRGRRKTTVIFNGLKYYSAIPGLFGGGICENSDCDAGYELVTYGFGFGPGISPFTEAARGNVVCPGCNESFKLLTLALYQCQAILSYQLWEERQVNQIHNIEWTAQGEEYVEFGTASSKAKQLDYTFLVFDVDPLD